MLTYDYDLQVWVRDGLVEPCGHPDKSLGLCWSCLNHGLSVEVLRTAADAEFSEEMDQALWDMIAESRGC